MADGTRLPLRWLCTRRRALPLGAAASPLAWIGKSAARLPLPRLKHECWVRYRIDLARIPPPPAEVALRRADSVLVARLRKRPERGENQFSSALRFWEYGFGDLYLWMEGEEPLCMQGLILPEHQTMRIALGTWAGMYPPFAAPVGMVENLYTFPRGMRRRGGAATAMALAVCAEAKNRGMRELRTHIHAENLAAHRWAARVGWEPFGMIHRLAIDLPGLRRRYLYLHA